MTRTRKIVQILPFMYCLLQLYFVFYSNILYLFIACQTQKVHTPLKGSFHASKRKKRAGISLPNCVGRVSQDVHSAGTIKTITDTMHALYTNALVVVHNLEPQRGQYLKTVKFPYPIGFWL